MPIPVVTTYLIQGSSVVGYYKYSNGKLSYKEKSCPLTGLLTAVLGNFKVRQAVLPYSQYFCLARTPKKTMKLTCADLEELLQQAQLKEPINLLQVPTFQTPQQCAQYSINLLFTSKGLMTTLHRIGHDTTKQVSNKQILDKGAETLRCIMSTVEHTELKRVVQLDLEFFIDENHALWISYVRNFKVVFPEVCLGLELRTEEDIKRIPRTEVKRSRKLVRKALNFASVLETNGKYLYTRGQLRNRSSDVKFPIPMLPPVPKPLGVPFGRPSQAWFGVKSKNALKTQRLVSSRNKRAGAVPQGHILRGATSRLVLTRPSNN